MPETQVADPVTDQQETEALLRKIITRERVLLRLWEIAEMSPELTRNSASAPVKALSIIVAIEGLIPDRRQKPSDPSPPQVNIFSAAKYNEQQQEAAASQASPDPVPHQKEPAIPDPPAAAAADVPSDPEQAANSAFSESHPAHSLTPQRTNPWVPEAAAYASIPDQSVPFSIPKKRFGRRR